MYKTPDGKKKTLKPAKKKTTFKTIQGTVFMSDVLNILKIECQT